MSTEESEVIDMRAAILMSEPEPAPTTNTREPIKARTKAEFDTKIKELLKAQYPVGSEVNVYAFCERYAVRPSNVKRLVGELTIGGYLLTIPIIATMGPSGR